MKTKKQQLTRGLIRSTSFLSIMMFLSLSCMGPEGPMGPRGFDGQDGEAFAYSAIYDVDPFEWEGDADGYMVTLDVPEITEDIYYYGAVLVYRLIEIEPKSFNLLPYTYVDNGFMVYVDFDAYVGSIDVYYKEVVDGINDTYPPESVMTFKVVIVEGIPLATLKGMVDVNDFSAVSKMLNIENGMSK